MGEGTLKSGFELTLENQICSLVFLISSINHLLKGRVSHASTYFLASLLRKRLIGFSKKSAGNNIKKHKVRANRVLFASQCTVISFKSELN